MLGTPKTMEGVRNVGWALLLFVALQILAVVFVALVLLFLPDVLGPGGGAGPGGFGPGFALLIAASCGIAILGLVGLIFFLLGFFRMQTGREEYGPEQSRNMQRALWLLIGSIVAVVVGIVVAVMLFVLTIPGGLEPGGAPPVPPPAALAAAVGASIAASLFQDLMLVQMILALTPMSQRQFLWMGLLLGIAGSGVSSAAPFVVATPGLEAGPLPGLGPELTWLAVIGAALGFASLAIFLWRFRVVHADMQAGRILPVPLVPRADLWPTPPSAWPPPPSM